MRKVIGLHSCREALKVRASSVQRLLLKQGWEKSADLAELGKLAQQKKVKITTVPLKDLDTIGMGHQGIALEVLTSPELDLLALEKQKRVLLLGLDGIEDPQNLGAILRSAWIFGAAGALVPSSRAIAMTPTVAKVACGGAEYVPLDVHSNLLTPLERLKKSEFWVYGLSEKAERTIWDVQIPDKIVWVIGNEGAGIRKSTLGVCDELVQIPQVYPDASLNASVSAAIAMAETRRRWHTS